MEDLMCKYCAKKYVKKKSLEKHEEKCYNMINMEIKDESLVNNNVVLDDLVSGDENEEENIMNNNYDINLTLTEDNKIKVESGNDDEENGEEALKNLLKPKVSTSYKEEIEKLEELINYVSSIVPPEDEDDKDRLIKTLRNTIQVTLDQSKNLIKEMEQMAKKNSYLKNNIMLAAYLLDKCKKDVPEDIEFEK